MAKKSSNPTKIESKRVDYWDNILTNIGSNCGRVNSTRYQPTIKLDRQTLTDIYTSDGIGRRVVNIVVDDALRGFINTDDNLIKDLNRVKAKQRIIEAASWGRLYGGAILVAFVDDGQEMDKPLNIKSVKKLVSLKAYDRWQLYWDQTDLSINYYDEHYGEPDIFTITPINNIPFRVHRSRCHIFGGERVPDIERIRNNYWDNSVLQSVFEALRNYGSTMNASAEIIQDFIQTIISIDGLANIVVQGNDDLITKRATLIDLTRSVANTVFLDAENETYQKHSSTVSGLPELWDRFSEAICATTGIPITKLFGRSPSGLNSNGEHDVGNWFDIVEAYRNDEIRPCLDWLINMVESQSMWASKDRPKTYEWDFPSLKTPNESEWADIKHKIAQIDKIYMDVGAIDPQYLFELRYADGEFKPDIVIDPAYMDKLAKEEKLEILPDNSDLIQVKANRVNNDAEIKLNEMKEGIRLKLHNKINNILKNG